MPQQKYHLKVFHRSDLEGRGHGNSLRKGSWRKDLVMGCVDIPVRSDTSEAISRRLCKERERDEKKKGSRDPSLVGNILRSLPRSVRLVDLRSRENLSEVEIETSGVIHPRE